MPVCKLEYNNNVYNVTGIYYYIMLLCIAVILTISLYGAVYGGLITLSMQMFIICKIVDTFFINGATDENTMKEL
jgi:hypothetical protein